MNKKTTHFIDEGLVLRKNSYKDTHQLVTFFTQTHGKIVLSGYGTKKLTSKRLSHLETGNVIRLSWYEDGEYGILQETDLLYAHSRIKEDVHKLDNLYLILFILHKLLPEKLPEVEVYRRTLALLKKLHSESVHAEDTERFLKEVLVQLGYVNDEHINDSHFDSMSFIEGLLGRKLPQL